MAERYCVPESANCRFKDVASMFFFSSRRRHTRWPRDWSSDVALPIWQPVTNIPRGLDVVSQAFNSDVGVDNDPIQFNGGYVWYDVIGVTPSRERPLDEVRDQVEAKWRDDQIASRLRTKATEMVQRLDQGGKLADDEATVGAKVDTATGFRRDAAP